MDSNRRKCKIQVPLNTAGVEELNQNKGESPNIQTFEFSLEGKTDKEFSRLFVVYNVVFSMKFEVRNARRELLRVEDVPLAYEMFRNYVCNRAGEDIMNECGIVAQAFKIALSLKVPMAFIY